MCAEFQVPLCLDCISSIGTVAVDLQGVYLASCASGKGLRAFPGLSMVFYHHAVEPAPQRLPRYLDLGYYASQNGIPFTFSSNLLHALHAAVKRVNWESRFAELAETGAWLRSTLRQSGWAVLAEDPHAAPAVVTVPLPPGLDSGRIGKLMEESGYLLSCHSEYLRERNWIQIALMGESSREKLVSVLNALSRARKTLKVIQPTSKQRAPAELSAERNPAVNEHAGSG